MNEHSNRKVFAASLRRMAERFDETEMPIDPLQELERAEELLIGLKLLATTELDPNEHINGVETDSLVDAVHALTEAGVLRVEVHPRFWSQWAEAMDRHRVEHRGADNYIPSALVEGTPVRSIVSPFQPCPRIGCHTCGHLHHQWTPQARPVDQLDPSLN